MPDVNGEFRVKVRANLKKRDPDTGEVLEEIEIPEHVIDDPDMVKKLRKEGVDALSDS